MIRTLVIDDEPIAVRRLRRLLSAFNDVEVTGDAANAEEARERIARLAPDVILLDIEMPGMNGIDLASELAGLDKTPAIVFVTAFSGFALAAFQVAAQHYLLKPVEPGHLEAAIRRVRHTLEEQRLVQRTVELEEVVLKLRASGGTGDGPKPHLWLPHARGRSRIRFDEILWIEADRDYVRVHAEGNTYFARRRIGQLSAELEPHGFARVHRAILVRRSAVTQIENIGDRIYRITLSTGDTVVSSRRFAAAARGLPHE